MCIQAIKGVGLPQGRYLVACGTEQCLRVFALEHLLKFLPDKESTVTAATESTDAIASTATATTHTTATATTHTVSIPTATTDTAAWDGIGAGYGTTSSDLFVVNPEWKSDLAAMKALCTQWVSASDASAIAMTTVVPECMVDSKVVNVVAVVGQGLHCVCFS